MTFAQPLVLLALLALPLLAVLYLAEQRRRRAAAAAFAAPPLQPSVTPHRPGWRRHAPPLALALALATLIVAGAKPQRTVAVPVEQASIVLAVDTSRSMTAEDVPPNRLEAARRAAREFVDEVPARLNVGVVSFDHAARVLQGPTRDRERAAAAIDGLQVGERYGTATGEAIAAALASARVRERAPAAIVLLSDGASTTGRDPLDAAREAGAARVPVYTVALGTPAGTIVMPGRDGQPVTAPVPPDPQTLAEVARISGGESYEAATAPRLDEVYERLGSRLAEREEQREVSAGFAAGGLTLLLTGMALSLRWFGRLI